MNVVAIIQARLSSTRLPEKVLLDIGGRPLIEWVVERTKMSRKVDRVVVATGNSDDNLLLVKWLESNGTDFYRGSDEDVLDRFYRASIQYDADVIVRITADDPFKDPAIVDKALDILNLEATDYCSNTIAPTYPEGLDVEVFTFEALQRAWKKSILPSEREHVTPYIWKNPHEFRISSFSYRKNLSSWRWTVDHTIDLEFVRCLASAVKNRLDVSGEELINVVENSPNLIGMCTGKIERNQGYLKSILAENFSNDDNR